MIERIILSLLTTLGAKLITYVMSQNSKKNTAPVDQEVIKDRLLEVRAIATTSLDGTPITPQQRKRLNEAIRNFVRSSGGSGL